VIDPPPASHREGFQPATLPEASRLLGVSESTVRRMVKAGRLEAERVLRPQGHVWMVMVPLPSTEPSAGSHQASAREGEQPSSGDALATWTRSVLEPLVAELSLMRQANERQAGQLISQAETLGRQGAELERARAERDAADVSRRRDTRRLSIALAVAGALAVVAMLAPGWVR
jgi:excisionase family DNA binding protein